MDDKLKKLQEQYNDVPIPTELEMLIEKNLQRPHKKKRKKGYYQCGFKSVYNMHIPVFNNEIIVKGLGKSVHHTDKISHNLL